MKKKHLLLLLTLLMTSALAVPAARSELTVEVTGAPADWVNSDKKADVNCSPAEYCKADSYKLAIWNYTRHPGRPDCDDEWFWLEPDEEKEKPELPFPISYHAWVCGKAKDTSNNPWYSKAVEFKVDKERPTTSIKCNGNACSEGWYKEDVTITLTCSDAAYGSGCTTTKYCTDQLNACSPSKIYTGPFTMTAEGKDYVRFYSSDKAGNNEVIQSKTIKIDNRPPSEVFVTGAPQAWQNKPATANVSCFDRGTGCNGGSSRLKLYSSEQVACPTTQNDYTLPVPQTITSHRWVCGTAKDNTGKAGYSSPVEFMVDTTDPTASISAPGLQNDFFTTGTASLLLVSNDTDSWVTDCRLKNMAGEVPINGFDSATYLPENFITGIKASIVVTKENNYWLLQNLNGMWIWISGNVDKLLSSIGFKNPPKGVDAMTYLPGGYYKDNKGNVINEDSLFIVKGGQFWIRFKSGLTLSGYVSNMDPNVEINSVQGLTVIPYESPGFFNLPTGVKEDLILLVNKKTDGSFNCYYRRKSIYFWEQCSTDANTLVNQLKPDSIAFIPKGLQFLPYDTVFATKARNYFVIKRPGKISDIAVFDKIMDLFHYGWEIGWDSGWKTIPEFSWKKCSDINPNNWNLLKGLIDKGDGWKTVLFEVKDALGWMTVASVSKILDTKGPVFSFNEHESTSSSDRVVIYGEATTEWALLKNVKWGYGPGKSDPPLDRTITASGGKNQDNQPCGATYEPECVYSNLAFEMKNLYEGSWRLCAEAVDVLGKGSGKACTDITIDTKGPSASMLGMASSCDLSLPDDYDTNNVICGLGLNSGDGIACKFTVLPNEHTSPEFPGTNTKQQLNLTKYNSNGENDGLKEIEYSCKDSLGNWGEGDTDGIHIDTRLPVTTDNADSETHGANYIVTLTCDDFSGYQTKGTEKGSGCKSTYYCIVGVTDNTTCTTRGSGFIKTDSRQVSIPCPSGQVCEKKIKYYSEDKAGNFEAIKQSAEIIIDMTEPWCLMGALNEYTNSITVDLSWSGGDPLGNPIKAFHVYYKKDSNTSWIEIGNFLPAIKDTTFYGQKNTKYYFMCRTETEKELGPVSQAVSTFIDVDPPVVTLSRDSEWANFNDGTKTFGFDVSTNDYGGSGVDASDIEIQWKDSETAAWQPWSTPIPPIFGANKIPVEPADAKTYYFRARAGDRAGNAGSWSDELKVKTDYLAPSCNITGIVSQNSGFILRWSGEDALSGVDSYDVQSSTDMSNWIILEDRTNKTERAITTSPTTTYFRCRARDKAGNVGSWSLEDSFTLDYSPPTITVEYTDTITYGDILGIEVRARDSEGVSSARVEIDKTPFYPVSKTTDGEDTVFMWEIAGLITSGSFTVYVSDINGNEVSRTFSFSMKECSSGQTKECGSNIGVCISGQKVCRGGFWSETCVDAVSGSDERCNGLDDDCDGTADNIFGANTMEASQCGCFGGSQPTGEVCNDIDDDCNGIIDDYCATCSDGKRNGNEEGTDCGGPDCDSCESRFFVTILVAVLILAAGLGAAAYYFFFRKKETSGDWEALAGRWTGREKQRTLPARPAKRGLPEKPPEEKPAESWESLEEKWRKRKPGQGPKKGPKK